MDKEEEGSQYPCSVKLDPETVKITVLEEVPKTSALTFRKCLFKGNLRQYLKWCEENGIKPNWK